MFILCIFRENHFHATNILRKYDDPNLSHLYRLVGFGHRICQVPGCCRAPASPSLENLLSPYIYNKHTKYNFKDTQIIPDLYIFKCANNSLKLLFNFEFNHNRMKLFAFNNQNKYIINFAYNFCIRKNMIESTGL